MARSPWLRLPLSTSRSRLLTDQSRVPAQCLLSRFDRPSYAKRRSALQGRLVGSFQKEPVTKYPAETRRAGHACMCDPAVLPAQVSQGPRLLSRPCVQGGWYAACEGGLALLALGDPCPRGLFEEFELPRTQLPALPGEPVVLGLAESWSELSQQCIVGLQAELDPLGASLLLISSGELVCLRPGKLSQAVVRSSRVRQLWPSGLGPWHRAPAANAAAGPGCVSARRCAPTLALLDEHGIVCWLWRSAQGAGALQRLQAALGQARLELQERQRLASGARRRDSLPHSHAELVVSLISAFTRTFGGDTPLQVASGEAPHGPAAREAWRFFR